MLNIKSILQISPDGTKLCRDARDVGDNHNLFSHSSGHSTDDTEKTSLSATLQPTFPVCLFPLLQKSQTKEGDENVL